MATNKLQWKRIAKGDKLPCQSFLRKKNGEILKLSTVAGVTVGQDAYYLPVDDVIEEIKNYPIEESKDEMISRKLIAFLKQCKGVYGDGFKQFGLDIDDAIAWLEKRGEMDMESYKAVENEKREFVGDGFIKCYADFQDFKEGKTYWLEYVGNDNYNVRSDNLLGKTYHITPCQLYTIFKKQTWLEKQCEPKPAIFIPKFRVGDKLVSTKNPRLTYEVLEVGHINELGNPEYKAEIFTDGKTENPRNIHYMECYKVDEWAKLIEQKPAEWSEEDEYLLDETIKHLEVLIRITKKQGSAYSDEIQYYQRDIDWLKFLKDKVQPQSTWRPSATDIKVLEEVIDLRINPINYHATLHGILEQLKKLREE